MASASFEEMDEQILAGEFHEATDTFCRLAVDGHDFKGLVGKVMHTAAPYLHVPAHEKLLPNGEFRNVNYDHTMLGIRAGLRLAKFLPEKEQNLPLVQAIYYVPQGLDVWAQIECGFPGHYAREQEKCDEATIGRDLFCHFEDLPPLVEGSVDQRFERMLLAITQGDKATSYRLFLGLAAEPALRDRLQDQILFAAIIDQQEYNSFRRVRHIGHKAIRARSMFEIADWLGWENAHDFFYIGIPDLCNAPIFHSLYDHASFLLGTAFKGAQYELMRTNMTPLSEADQDLFIGKILEGDPEAVAHQITAFYRDGKSAQSIADTVMIAHATHCVNRLRAPIAYTVPMHSFDYSNVVTHWLRKFHNMHQAKAPYLSAWFVTDTIREVDSYPDMTGFEKPDPDAFAGWADKQDIATILGTLEQTVFDQDPSKSVALVRSYTARTKERDRLISTLVRCASKYQGDAHIFRNARSIIEEYRFGTASEVRKNVLFEYWAHYLSYYMKRTLATDCFDMYQRYFCA